MAGKLDMMRVRATDPRPCPKCGKIYRSAHTLRTHMEDKHTVSLDSSLMSWVLRYELDSSIIVALAQD